ncbi:MAG: histidinol phosphate phosphatase domain-containing protein [Promethearchaeota archaeon]
MTFRADLHTHTTLSDGGLLPSELVRRAFVCGHSAVAITDHADRSNLRFLIETISSIVIDWEKEITLLPGIELTHVPPSKIHELAIEAKKLGAKIVVVHGETIVEPVAEGTNKAAVTCEAVDILAHPGVLDTEEAEAARENDIFLEITSRQGHCLTNGHVGNLVNNISGLKAVVNTDLHGIEFLTGEEAMRIALGAGLNTELAQKTISKWPQELIKRALE